MERGREGGWVGGWEREGENSIVQSASNHVMAVGLHIIQQRRDLVHNSTHADGFKLCHT